MGVQKVNVQDLGPTTQKRLNPLEVIKTFTSCKDSETAKETLKVNLVVDEEQQDYLNSDVNRFTEEEVNRIKSMRDEDDMMLEIIENLTK